MIGYIGIDQFGNHYQISKHPRKELMKHFGAKSASKIYRDFHDGPKQVGYVIKDHWINVYEVHEVKKWND